MRRAIIAAALFATVAFSASAQPSPTGAKHIVLVHGAFADGSGWRPVYDILTRDGYEVSIVQQPLTSLADDIRATRRELALQDGPIVLVGHSYAGAVISVAGEDAKVKALVYVAAFMPDKGESLAKLISTRPTTHDDFIVAEGGVTIEPSRFSADFAADVPLPITTFLSRSQKPIAGAAFEAPVTAAAWRSKPSYSILTKQDRALNPDLQRDMYKRSGAKVTTIDSSHAVFLSHPEIVAKVIEEAARAVR